MKNIFVKDPETAVNYLKPDSLKRLLITVGIKLVFSVGGMSAMLTGEVAGFTRILLFILTFAFVYDVCCLYQVCLHITQSVLIGFLLFLVIIAGIGFLLQHAGSLLAGYSADAALGGTAMTCVMALIFLIPFIIDMVRLIKLLGTGRRKEADAD